MCKQIKEETRCCKNCINYDLWFGDCFAEQEGKGNPLNNNFRSSYTSNIMGAIPVLGNRDSLCDLHESMYEESLK